MKSFIIASLLTVGGLTVADAFIPSERPVCPSPHGYVCGTPQADQKANCQTAPFIVGEDEGAVNKGTQVRQGIWFPGKKLIQHLKGRRSKCSVETTIIESN